MCIGCSRDSSGPDLCDIQRAYRLTKLAMWRRRLNAHCSLLSPAKTPTGARGDDTRLDSNKNFSYIVSVKALNDVKVLCSGEELQSLPVDDSRAI